jgi:ketosteroid isomerase-like protein
MADHGQAIIDLDKRRRDAMCRQDISALKELLADDLVYTHSSARVDTKESLLGGMEAGTTVYTSIETSDVQAQAFNDAVVLTGVARIGVTSNGRPNSFGVRFINVYANRGGNWQMVAWQSTRLAE